MKGPFKKRIRLTAFMSVFSILVVSIIGMMVESKSHAAVLPTSHTTLTATSANTSTLPGYPLKAQFSFNGVNLSQSEESEGKNAFSVTFKIPSGITLLPFNFNSDWPVDSNGKTIDQQKVMQWIADGNYVSTFKADTATAIESLPLLGGINPQTGEQVTPTTGGSSVSSGNFYTFEQYFINNCTQQTTGSSYWQGMADFSQNVSLTVTLGGTEYSLSNPLEAYELFEKLDYNIPSTSSSGYNGPGIVGPLTVSISMSGKALYLLGQFLGAPNNNSQFKLIVGLEPNNQTSNNSAYSAGAADISAEATYGGQSYTDDVILQQYGNPNSYQTTSTSLQDIEPSSNAGSLGLWFHAIGSNGSPLSRVKIELAAVSFQNEGAWNEGTLQQNALLIPSYWDPDNVNDAAVGKDYHGPDSLSGSQYQYYGWQWCTIGGNLYQEQNDCGFTLSSISGHPGYFGISGLPAGQYAVYFMGEGVQNVTGETPGIGITLDGYDEPEKFTGFNQDNANNNLAGSWVDNTTNTVSWAVNPSSQVLTDLEGNVIANPTSQDLTCMVSADMTKSCLDYQLETDLPYNSWTIKLNYNGYSINPEDIDIGGISISALQRETKTNILSSDTSGLTLTFNYSALNYVLLNGHGPATTTSNGGNEPLAMCNTYAPCKVAMTFPASLSSSFKNGDEITYTLDYAGLKGPQVTGNLTPGADTNGYAQNPLVSLPLATENSSQTGLWFQNLWKGTNEPATGAKFSVFNTDLSEYLEPVYDDGSFQGWNYSSKPYLFSEGNDSAYFSFGGLGNGIYKVQEVAVPSDAIPVKNFVFEVNLSYSSPEVLSSLNKNFDSYINSSRDVVYSDRVMSNASIPLTGGHGTLLFIIMAMLFIVSGSFAAFAYNRRKKKEL